MDPSTPDKPCATSVRGDGAADVSKRLHRCIDVGGLRVPGLLACIGGPHVNETCIDVGDLRAPGLLTSSGGPQGPWSTTMYKGTSGPLVNETYRCRGPQGPRSTIKYRGTSGLLMNLQCIDGGTYAAVSQSYPIRE